MRLPLKGNDYFAKELNAASQKIEEAYMEAIKPRIQMKKVNAMLGDGTVTQIDTFDPQQVMAFYQQLTNSLKGWISAGISKSATEDLHRVFCQFAKESGKYHLLGYFGIQFHTLPYYRVDKRVIEVQKELSLIADGAAKIFKEMTVKADKAVEAELEKQGYANLEFQELFTQMFEDEKLIEELDKKATSVEKEFPEFEKMRKKKTELFAELNDLLIEVYQTSPVSIDYNRLMQGEEGVVTYFDIEIIKSQKTKKREAYVNSAKVAAEVADKVAGELYSVADALRKMG